jgi:hypothetical protein
MDFEQLWRQYVHEQGLKAEDGDDDGPSEDGLYVLPSDSGHYMFVVDEPQRGTVLLKAIVAFLPIDGPDDAATYRHLLQAHLLGEATGGACFAIEPDTDDLILYRRLPLAGLDAARLADEMETLLGTTVRLAEMLQIPPPAQP